MRGKDRFNSLAKSTVLLTLKDLNQFADRTLINHASFKLHASTPVKIVATGTLVRGLIVELPATAGAQQAIVKAKGEYRGAK